jgi:tetratricopeptide (TPR) repeat protein
LDSVDVDEAFPVHSNPTNPDEIAAANIEKIPQTAKAIQKDAEVMLKKGRNYFRTGEYDKAVMQFSQVIKSGGNRKLALYNRGVALFKLNKRDAALKDFKNAARLGHQKAKAILNKIKPPLIMSSVTSEK